MVEKIFFHKCPGQGFLANFKAAAATDFNFAIHQNKKKSRIFHELFGRMRFDRLGEKLSDKNLTIDTFKISLVIFLELGPVEDTLVMTKYFLL